MKIIFPNVILSSMLVKVSKTASTGSSNNEVLKHLLIQANDHGCAMVGTNMELSGVVRSSEVEVERSGIVLLPALMLKRISDHAGDLITLETIEDDQVEISTDGTSWKLYCLDHSLFPEVPRISPNAQQVPRAMFLEALNFTKAAVGQDQSRPSLTFVSFDERGAYSTDGTRAHYHRVPEPPVGLQVSILAIPPLIAQLRVCTDDFISIDVGQTHIVYQIGSDWFASRIMDIDFPDVRHQLLEPRLTSHTQSLSVGRQRLLLAINRAQVIADDRKKSVVSLRLMEGVCEVSSVSMKGDSSNSRIPVSFDGTERRITLFADGLLDLLRVVSDEMVEFLLHPSKNEGALLYRSASSQAILFPRALDA
jgi:DNA polymerase III sliding clamp (beta) subunit (PCNA family)